MFSVNVTLGASKVAAFAGIGGGTDNAMGLSLTGVDFGMALMSEQLTGAPGEAAPRKWTSLQATAAGVDFVGMGNDLKISATDLRVAVNQASGAATVVVDYAKNQLAIATGPGSSLALTECERAASTVGGVPRMECART